VNARVSVVIPVRDRADCVADAVASAFDQDPAPHQILVVDDASTDGSDEAAASAAGSPRVIRLSRPLGPSAARNAGIRAATGDWLAFLDSDDRWLPGALATRLRAAERASGVVLVSGNAESWDGNRVLRPRMLDGVDHGPGDDPLARLLGGNFVLTSTVIARRDAVLRAGGFATHLSRCEDYDLWLRLARQGSFVFVDEVLARYRVGPGGLSSDADRMLEAEARVLREAIARPGHELPPGPARIARERIGRLWMEAGYADLVGQRSAAARRKLLRALGRRGSRSRAFLYLAASLLPASAIARIRAARGRVPEAR
jgi:glycosyltransferase involved in cell wall biosynthesis